MAKVSLKMIVACGNQRLFDQFCSRRSYDEVRAAAEREQCDPGRVEAMIRRNAEPSSLVAHVDAVKSGSESRGIGKTVGE